MKPSSGIGTRAGVCGALLLTAGLALTACSGQDETKSVQQAVSQVPLDPDTPAWKQDDSSEITTLTWYVNAEWWITDWGNDVVTQQIEKDCNVKIDFIAGDDTKLNTLFAGDNMPDIITLVDSSGAVAQKADTWALPLEETANQYDPYFNKIASGQTMDWMRLGDGKVYGYPNYSCTQEDYDSGKLTAKTAFVIRKDVYEALGEPQMGTQEQFTAVIDQIKQQYPELVPFGFTTINESEYASVDVAFQDFIGVPLTDADGNFYDRTMDEDYLSWLKTFSRVYRNGGISDDCFVDDGQAFQAKIAAGKYATALLEGTAGFSGYLTTWNNKNPGAEYIAIDGPQSTKGNQPTLNQQGLSGWMTNYITQKCKNPQKAMQLFTYLLSDEGQILTTYGIQDQTFTINSEGKYQLTEEMTNMQQEDNDGFKKKIRVGEFFFFGHDKYKVLSDDAFPPSIHQMQAWGEGKLMPHFVLENIEPDPGTAEARIAAAIKTEWSTVMGGLIRSQSDEEFETILANYQQFLKDNDYDSVVAVKNEKIKRNMEKLGK